MAVVDTFFIPYPKMSNFEDRTSLVEDLVLRPVKEYSLSQKSNLLVKSSTLVTFKVKQKVTSITFKHLVLIQLRI